MRTRLIGIGIILLFGAVRMPFEEQLEQEHRRERFHGAKLDLDMRQRLGQSGFIAALGGFRAAVADVLYLQAHSAWERVEWGRMKLLYDTVTALQPRCAMFWDTAGWHMAWNASVAAREDEKQPREALRLKAEREYWRLGEDFLQRGIQNNPDTAFLYERLGMLYRDIWKFNDPVKAFPQFEAARQLPDAMPYVRRFATYTLAEIPGREREAYARAKALYEEGPSERLPTLLTTIHDLEKKLGIPRNEQIYLRAIQELAASGQKVQEEEAYGRARSLQAESPDERDPVLEQILHDLEEKLDVPLKERVYNPLSQPR